MSCNDGGDYGGDVLGEEGFVLSVVKGMLGWTEKHGMNRNQMIETMALTS